MIDDKSKTRVLLKVSNGDCLEKKLMIITKMRFYREPVSMYKVAKDLHSNTSSIYYPFNQLVNEGIIQKENEKFILVSCLKHIDYHLSYLIPFIESVVGDNPEKNLDEIDNLVSYMLAITSIEVEEN